MPCPAQELDAIGPFVAMFRFESTGKTFVANVVRGWRECACGAFGHGMPCPYCRKRRQNDVVIRAENCELWRVFTLRGPFVPQGRRECLWY